MGYRNEREALIGKYTASTTEEDYQAALKAYEKALQEQPDNLVDLLGYAELHGLRSQIDLEKSIKYYEKAIQIAKDQDMDNYYSANRQLIMLNSRAGKNHVNIDRYKKLLKENPGDIEMYSFLAESYLNASQYSDAWEAAQAGLKLNPNNVTINFYAGDICKAFGEYDKAFEFWDKTLLLAPDDASALYSKVFLYRDLGRLDKAIETWKDIIAFLETHGYDDAVAWPREELAKLEKEIQKK